MVELKMDPILKRLEEDGIVVDTILFLSSLTDQIFSDSNSDL